jgi:inner membrane protein
MDSLTHIALGACIGEAFFERGFGKKAMLLGALAHSVPDIDFVAHLWMNTPESLLAHRGFTHSLLFAALITPVLAMAASRVHRSRSIRFRKWIFFFAIQIILHLLLDGFNNYGVGWLEPFSHHRFSINAIYVADPFFSFAPALALLALIFHNAHHKRRGFWWRFGIIIPFIYLGYCTVNKIKITSDVKDIFAKQQIPHERWFTTPAPLNNWLWYVVAGTDSGYYVGFRSLFDRERRIDFQFFPRNAQLLEAVEDHESLQQLVRFSKGFYTVETWGDTLVFNDLRFGQMLGWQNPHGQFVFHYYLSHPKDNELVVQRGRFQGWNWGVVKGLWSRMWGK